MKKWEIIGSGGSSGNVDLTNYYNKTETYNKTEIDSKISSAGSFNPALYYPKTESYNRSEIDKELDKKVSKTEYTDKIVYFNSTLSTLSTKIAGIETNYLDREQIKSEYYSKTEVNKKINTTLENMNIKNISTYIKYMPSDVVTLEMPAEKWKSIQNFELSNVTNNITININFQPSNPDHVDESEETRCISGLIFADKSTEDPTVHITTVPGLQVVKVGDFADNTYKKGINILSYFWYNRKIYIVKVA